MTTTTPSNQFALLTSQRFLPLFLTQFLGAFNDNVLKTALVVFFTYQGAQWTSLAPSEMANIGGGLFIAPFFLFSALAGQCADKFNRARIARYVKVMEIIIMGIAILGFYWHSLVLLMTALCMMGLHSTFFGPVKYALLPQMLKEQELVGGNALVEAGTFIAILLGTLLGTALAAHGDLGILCVTLLLIAIAGLITSLWIPQAHAAGPSPELRLNINIITATWRTLAQTTSPKSVFQSILAISWFWLYGALFLAQIPPITKELLGGNESAVTLLLLAFTLGVGLGSLACEKMSRHQIEPGLVVIGAVGLTLFGIAFAAHMPVVPATGIQPVAVLFNQGPLWHLMADLLLLGVCGGVYCVPLYAIMQQRSDPLQRARVIAGNNILNALFIVVGAIATGIALLRGVHLKTLFYWAAGINAIVAIYIFTQVPEFLQRCRIWLRGGRA